MIAMSLGLIKEVHNMKYQIILHLHNLRTYPAFHRIQLSIDPQI